ncbi:hypothetical protein CVT25_001718 [Psilocybe cyanescens]|uniref:HNH nuclease domain-containing protein n=1 Tax=Psilocybe cyanescens TaxID=93625 RepID=A0A409WPG2_PSICY|nr:hypothetical protein CVT25_001718 [Psilocybe cyanescens]
MTSLPRKLPQRLQHLAHVVTAYDMCLKLEDSLQIAVNNGDDIGRNLIYIWILGYLIHHVPTETGLDNITQEINPCHDNSTILALGQMYYDHYIMAFQANKSHTPTPSDDASPPSFDNIQDMINVTLQGAPQSHTQAKAYALIRDRYCCVVTGAYDVFSVETIQELATMYKSDPSARLGFTQCAHIFPASANLSIEPGSAKQQYASTLWAILYRFGYENLLDELNGSNVHHLENVMTLEPRLHTHFDRFDIWLVATNKLNRYMLESHNVYILRGYPEFVTFTTPDPENLPVPSPIYLAIHATCAKVAQLSEAAACINKFYQDMEEAETLDPNGVSADTLEHAIIKLQTAGYEVTT